MRQLRKYIFNSLLIIVFFASCDEEQFDPKIRGYSKVVLPQHQYQTFVDASFPYTFDYPVYGKTIKDTVLPGIRPDNPYWMNIDFKQWGAKVYLTYKPIGNNPQNFYNYLKDTYTMSDAHEKKAAYIKEPEFNTTNNVHGVLFDVGGNTASALQFYATDSHQHFIRGALYFDVSPNVDSLAPINAFLRADVEHMIKSLKWTK